ncbi:hypothetical protein IW492_01820 [Enterococcus sp. BWB1-3]|uniref:hypothetical protein n=1 Tax=Enterococcus sp. BWB1-3 TaxID=2787713 RepID=UPI001920FC4F|nr:hypothetical protein [Enterococcus sp. BWB1-3]MBL1227966.1 hypothetical protein [Enterococcus sp. BWB1-3]
MKKLALSLLVFGVFLGISGCGSNANEGGKISSNSVEESTTDSSDKEDKKMEAMEEDLKENGVKISYHKKNLTFIREKGIDYDYFQLMIKFDSKSNEIYEMTLRLKGNIDGKEKDTLFYNESSGRIVESTAWNTDINAIAKTLESLNYSDKEILEFAHWYYEKNM